MNPQEILSSLQLMHQLLSTDVKAVGSVSKYISEQRAKAEKLKALDLSVDTILAMLILVATKEPRFWLTMACMCQEISLSTLSAKMPSVYEVYLASSLVSVDSVGLQCWRCGQQGHDYMECLSLTTLESWRKFGVRKTRKVNH